MCYSFCLEYLLTLPDISRFSSVIVFSQELLCEEKQVWVSYKPPLPIPQSSYIFSSFLLNVPWYILFGVREASTAEKGRFGKLRCVYLWFLFSRAEKRF